ncbi:MAG: D-2-hydroxyacid dehydrogenase [Caldilineaceae bacterium]|nr:D-2-hydroxyacid dehydrogenase [Caldilineaceae bacterium]
MPKFIMLPPQNERTRSWAARLVEALPDYTVVTPEDAEETRREIVDADAAYGTLPADLLPLAQNLRWLQSPAIAPPTGFYYPALAEHPVVIANPRGTFNDHIGQHIMMYVLGLARGLPYYMDAQRNRRWDKDARQSAYIDLGSATALIVGVGGIGQEAAKLCNAFGMRVIGVDARWEFDAPAVERHGPEEVDALLPEADFVILTIPHTPQTEGTWNAARFAHMKAGAHFINIGRGKTTVLDDLVAAIEAGKIAGAGLDVFEEEPLPADHPLWLLPNVILTPHVAADGATNISERQFQLLVENARRFAAGEELLNVVDKTLWY